MKKKDRETPRGPLQLDQQALCSVDGGNPFARLLGSGKPKTETPPPAPSSSSPPPSSGSGSPTVNPATGQMTGGGGMSTKDMVKGAGISGAVMAPLFLGPWAIDKMGQSDAPPGAGDPNKYV